jgi:hypothetical protein
VPNGWSVSCPKTGCEYETLTAIEAAATADADLIIVHFSYSTVGNGCDRVKEHLVVLAYPLSNETVCALPEIGCDPPQQIAKSGDCFIQYLRIRVVGKVSFIVVFQ